jgi:hypothetical protein
MALYFNIELGDLQTIPSQNKTGTNEGRHKRVINSSSNNNSQVSELSSRLY